MRIVVPYTHLAAETLAALDASGAVYEPIRLRRDDDYWQLLADLWGSGETFAVVEQDIVIRPDTLTLLEACQADWCAFGYPYVGTDPHFGLGCTKFAAHLAALHPDALKDVGDMEDDAHAPKHWCRLDAWLSGLLFVAGEPRCEHQPPVGHLNLYPTHGCVPIPKEDDCA